jgi:hypothetical protein
LFARIFYGRDPGDGPRSPGVGKLTLANAASSTTPRPTAQPRSGSFSIKKVLPALVPDLSYSKLDIKDGDTAITRFARMAKGEVSGDEAEMTRTQLLEYCAMDTYAMLRLHKVLLGLTNGDLQS